MKFKFVEGKEAEERTYMVCLTGYTLRILRFLRVNELKADGF